MKKVVSLVLVVLVATLMSAQVFASSPSSGGSPSLVDGPEDLVITPYASRNSAPAAEITDELNAAKAELDAAADPKSLVSTLTGDKLTYGDLFDASHVVDGEIVSHDGCKFVVTTDLKKGADVQVIHRVDGGWEKVEASVKADGQLEIVAPSCSAFAVVRTTSSSDDTSPQTGNQILVMYGVGAVLFTAAAVVLLRKKENA